MNAIVHHQAIVGLVNSYNASLAEMQGELTAALAKLKEESAEAAVAQKIIAELKKDLAARDAQIKALIDERVPPAPPL